MREAYCCFYGKTLSIWCCWEEKPFIPAMSFNMSRHVCGAPSAHERSEFARDIYWRACRGRERSDQGRQKDGAPRRNRTGTPLRERDFESRASTSSARGASKYKHW